MVSYNELVNTFELAINQNPYYKGFGHGGIEKIDAVVNQGYPLFFVRPITSIGLLGEFGKERLLTFEFYSLDVPKLSDEDNRKVLSNTEQGLYDFFAFFNDGPVQYDLQIQMVNIIPLLEVFQDRAVGWVSTCNLISDAVGVSYCVI